MNFFIFVEGVAAEKNTSSVLEAIPVSFYLPLYFYQLRWLFFTGWDLKIGIPGQGVKVIHKTVDLEKKRAHRSDLVNIWSFSSNTSMIHMIVFLISVMQWIIRPVSQALSIRHAIMEYLRNHPLMCWWLLSWLGYVCYCSLSIVNNPSKYSQVVNFCWSKFYTYFGKDVILSMIGVVSSFYSDNW